MTQTTNTPQAQKPDPIDWKTYDAGGFKPMPLPGSGYTLKVQKVDFGPNPGAAPTRNSGGYLQATVDFEVVAPGDPYNGYLVRFNRFSTKKWAKRNGNPMGDLLKGAGSQAQPQTDADYVKALQAITNQTVTGSLKWEIYSSDHTGADGKALNLSSAKNADQFATDPKTGSMLPYVVVKGANGKEEKVYANARVGFINVKPVA